MPGTQSPEPAQADGRQVAGAGPLRSPEGSNRKGRGALPPGIPHLPWCGGHHGACVRENPTAPLGRGAPGTGRLRGGAQGCHPGMAWLCVTPPPGKAARLPRPIGSLRDRGARGVREGPAATPRCGCRGCSWEQEQPRGLVQGKARLRLSLGSTAAGGRPCGSGTRPGFGPRGGPCFWPALPWSPCRGSDSARRPAGGSRLWPRDGRALVPVARPHRLSCRWRGPSPAGLVRVFAASSRFETTPAPGPALL